MDKKISQLDLVTVVDQNDVLPIVNGGITKKIKVSQLTNSGGATDLTYTPSPTNGIVNSSTGTDATLPLADSTNAGLFTPAEKTKLSGIAAGAEVNVNSDWNAVSGDAQILNKPTLTSDFTNDGADGVNPFITALDIPTTGQASTIVREVKNMTGATLTKGTVVYISGANGNKALVSKALATTDALSSRTFGLLQSNISNNGLGNCVIMGDLSGLDTSTFAEGDQLYLSGVTAGTYTATKILAPTHLVYVGKVTRSHPTLGQIEVGIQNGYELSEIHDVALSSEANNQVLTYETSTDLWKNKSIGTILGYTPYRYVDTTRTNVSGTLTESILNTIVINPNSFNANDLMKVMWKNAKTTNLATMTIRLRSNTTNTLTGATLLATSSMGTANRSSIYLRHFDLIAGTISGFDSGTAIGSDLTVSASNPSVNVYDTTSVLYLFTTIQLGNVGDTVTSNFVNITN